MNYIDSANDWNKWINNESKYLPEIFIDEEKKNYDFELEENIFSKNYYKIEYEYNHEKKSINIDDSAFILQDFKENNNKYFIIKPVSELNIVHETYCTDDNDSILYEQYEKKNNNISIIIQVK